MLVAVAGEYNKQEEDCWWSCFLLRLLLSPGSLARNRIDNIGQNVLYYVPILVNRRPPLFSPVFSCSAPSDSSNRIPLLRYEFHIVNDNRLSPECPTGELPVFCSLFHLLRPLIG